MNKGYLLSAICGQYYTGILPTDDKLKAVLEETLKGSELFVIENRFGDKSMTLKEVAAIYRRTDGVIGVTPERIRQIESRAIRKLRFYSRTDQLGILKSDVR